MSTNISHSQEQLFDSLNNISPKEVVKLYYFYQKLLADNSDIELDMSNTAQPLGHVEQYTFEVDRLISMCKATQDAVLKIADKIEGSIYVIEAGVGIGVVALSALALNKKLDNRVKVFGLEINPKTVEKAQEMFEYYNIPKESYCIMEADALTINDIPPAHILISEHLQNGFFSQEPQFKILENLVPKLRKPFYIIPEGVDVYGKVTDREKIISIDKLFELVRERTKHLISNRDALIDKIDPRLLKNIIPVDSQIISTTLLTRFDFNKIFTGEQTDEVDLHIRKIARKSGVGIVELRSVPFFHNDNEFPQRLSPINWYKYLNNIHYGTFLNQWDLLHDEEGAFNYISSGQMNEDIRKKHTMNINDWFNERKQSLDRSTTKEYEKGVPYDIRIHGRFDYVDYCPDLTVTRQTGILDISDNSDTIYL